MVDPEADPSVGVCLGDFSTEGLRTAGAGEPRQRDRKMFLRAGERVLWLIVSRPGHTKVRVVRRLISWIGASSSGPSFGGGSVCDSEGDTGVFGWSSVLRPHAKLMQRLRPRLASTVVSLESTTLTFGVKSFLSIIAAFPII